MKPTETKDKATLAGRRDRPTATPAKKAYSRPQLRAYGSVRNLTQTGFGSGADGGSNPNMQMVSDRKAKENLVRIGEHPLGIGLYLFDYKPGYREILGNLRQFGVMADEVETVMPQAVSMHADGYKVVDYEMLGIYHAVQ